MINGGVAHYAAAAVPVFFPDLCVPFAELVLQPPVAFIRLKIPARARNDLFARPQRLLAVLALAPRSSHPVLAAGAMPATACGLCPRSNMDLRLTVQQDGSDLIVALECLGTLRDQGAMINPGLMAATLQKRILSLAP